MSWQTYSKWWIVTKEQLKKLTEIDKKLKDTLKPTKDRTLASHLAGGLYARYSLLVQEIDACLDQTCQVQKRMTIRKLMDAATIRLNELKEELVKIDLSEYHYIDGALVELKVIPHSVEILHPALMVHRTEEIQNMWERIQRGETIFEKPPEPEETIEERPSFIDPIKSLLEQRLSQMRASKVSKVDETPKEEKPPEEKPPEEKPSEEKPPEQSEEEDKKKKKRPKRFMPKEVILTPEELEALKKQQEITRLVTIIQKMERARQDRLYFLDISSRKGSRGVKKKASISEELLNAAAILIQKTWRGYAVRELMKKREIDRRLLIGMYEPSWRSKAEFEKLERTIQRRRELRDQHIRDYIKANLDEKERLLRVVGPGLMEDIGDEIREWFYQWYIRAKNFDKYPEEEDGGTVLVVRGETMTPEEWIDEVERKRRAKVKKGGMDKEAKRKEKEKLKKEKLEKKKKEAEQKKRQKELEKKLRKRGEDFEFKFTESAAAGEMKDAFVEDRKLWLDRKDEDNPTETHYMDWITDEKCYEMQLELRKKVDELMRLELDMLNDALERDKIRLKGKKGKKKKPKKKKKKKKKKKDKKKKDPTKHRLTEDLFQELVDNGIIHTYPKTYLSEYKGDFSYQNWEQRNLEFDPPAVLGDVRQAVTLNCILPLGVEKMNKPRSCLIAGPKLSGKHLLANAVFTETNCVLFDLSPEVLAGKYPGKAGMKMLLHLINKMSRLLQPSVLFINGGERPFYKKVPKPEKALEPKRIGNKLFKGIVKTITPEDKVFLLGISDQPWAGKQKAMMKAYERIIMIPKPDYGSIYLYWRELLMGYHGIDRNLDISAISKVTVGYPLPYIREAVEKVLTPRRIIQLKRRPLDLHELLEVLLDTPGPVPDKLYNKFIKFYNKTPLGKRKAQYMAITEKKREAAKRAAEKQKKKR